MSPWTCSCSDIFPKQSPELDFIAQQMILTLALDSDHGCLRALLQRLCLQTIKGSGSVDLDDMHDCFEYSTWPQQIQDKLALVHSCALEHLAAVLESRPNLVRSKNKLYLKMFWNLLEQMSGLICEHLGATSPLVLEDAQGAYLQGLNTDQKRALQEALRSRFMVLSGGPGTGKTFTAARILWALNASMKVPGNLKVALLAPTGKAAVRLSESIQTVSFEGAHIESMTLHRLFAKGKREGGYQRSINPIPYHIVLVDEASMVDIRLFMNLLEGIHPKTRLILMGDPYQLPPVESAGVFGDLCQFLERHGLGYAHLRTSLRAQNQHLNAGAQATHHGDWSGFAQLLKDGSIECSEDLGSSLFERYNQKNTVPMSPLAALEKLSEHAILCSSHHGPLGTQLLNQKIFNQMRDQVLAGSSEFLDIPVMATVNQPQLSRVNGEMGMVRLVREELWKLRELEQALEGTKGAYFYNGATSREIFVPRVRLQALAPAWAISVHKSQGSEYDHVTVILSQASKRFGRSLLYTAMTRAKKKLSFVASQSVLQDLILSHESSTLGLTDCLEKVWLENKKSTKSALLTSAMGNEEI